LVCGIAPNSIALIIGRAIAGLGSAGLFSGALIIVAYSVPLAKRPMYTGFIGASKCLVLNIPRLPLLTSKCTVLLLLPVPFSEVFLLTRVR